MSAVPARAGFVEDEAVSHVKNQTPATWSTQANKTNRLSSLNLARKHAPKS